MIQKFLFPIFWRDKILANHNISLSVAATWKWNHYSHLFAFAYNFLLLRVWMNEPTDCVNNARISFDDSSEYFFLYFDSWWWTLRFNRTFAASGNLNYWRQSRTCFPPICLLYLEGLVCEVKTLTNGIFPPFHVKGSFSIFPFSIFICFRLLRLFNVRFIIIIGREKVFIGKSVSTTHHDISIQLKKIFVFTFEFFFLFQGLKFSLPEIFPPKMKV